MAAHDCCCHNKKSRHCKLTDQHQTVAYRPVEDICCYKSATWLMSTAQVVDCVDVVQVTTLA